MSDLRKLLENNRAWSDSLKAHDPGFFQAIAQQQTPSYLWIGCSDSRVPATQLVGLIPGELFVHRNVANVVVHTDLNCLSVVQYAVEVLRVSHVIVCGHYGCGGIQAAYRRNSLGLIDNWLRHVQDVHDRHTEAIARAASEEEATDRLCELNVVEQARNVCQTSVLRDAWSRGQQIAVHSWIYSLRDGLLRDLSFIATRTDDVASEYARAVASLKP